MLDAMLYAVMYLGLIPKIMETVSSSDNRLQKIKELIKDSEYGIHDISRCRVSKNEPYPRFNMPFELGLDIGCSEFGNNIQRKKKTLILEKDRYSYQRVISDISGQDIENHDDNPEILIEKVRNWIAKLNPDGKYPPPTEVWTSFTKFYSKFNKVMKLKKYTRKQILNIPRSEYITIIKKWIIGKKIDA